MDRQDFERLVAPYQARIVVDIGAGDGLFVYRSARANPNYFYIGIDPNHSNLIKISEKIYRKPSRGGAPNALFIQAAVQELPSELEGIAQQVCIQFPWGNLLRYVAVGDKAVLTGLRKICREDALLKIIFSLDPHRDHSEMERLTLPAIDKDYVEVVLAPRYKNAGFELIKISLLSSEEYSLLRSSWAKRLQHRKRQSALYLICRLSKP